jgi:hypothetical protein
MSDYGFKITLPGSDVKTDTNIQDFVLKSTYQTIKTYITGTASFSIPNEIFSESNHNIVTVNHGLSYAPLCFMYWASNDGKAGGDFWWQKAGSGAWSFIQWQSTNSQFKIDYLGGAGITGLTGFSWTFKYYIFIQQAS